MRQSSNPVFSNLDKSRGGVATMGGPQAGFQQQGFQQQFGQQGYGQPQAHPQQAYAGNAERPMTIDDVVTKTAITLGVIIAVGAVAFYLSTMGLALPLLVVGGIGGFIMVLVSSFGKKYGSAPVTLAYAGFEGLFVGAATYVFTHNFSGGNTGSGALSSVLGSVGTAILGTVGVFIGMLVVYKTGAIRVTPKFTRFMTAAIFGVLIAALGSFVLSFFTGSNPLYDGGPIAIGFCLLCIGLAAFSFLLDFDQADRLVRAGAPARMAWGVALGLAVTLVWLYIEILRLLSYLRN